MRALAVFLLVSGAAWAQVVYPTLESLPTPLRLPPGLHEVLPLNSNASYYSESVRMVQCPDDKDNPFGDCSNFLFGGRALYASQLSGNIDILFDRPRRNIAHFEVSHPGNLRGAPTRLKAPYLYDFPLQENIIFDSFDKVSEGDLNLVTGEVTNLVFYAFFYNKFYDAFGKSNPKLQVGDFAFPGAYGTTYAIFEQRADGLLDLSFHGTTYLPLGNQIHGDPVRLPLPICGVDNYCNTIEAPGTSFNPSIQYTTKVDHPSLQGDCGDVCSQIPFNSIQIYTSNTYFTSFLDRFNLNIQELGGHSVSRTHFQGRMEVQFGNPSGDIVPVLFHLLLPEGLLGKPDTLESILHTYLPLSSNKGATPGFVGHNERLVFPSGLTYFPHNVSLASDAYDTARGALNLKSGKFVWDLLYPGFLTHDFIMKVLEQNNGRIPLSSFTMRGPANIERDAGGEWILRADTRTFRNYENLLFPAPDFDTAKAMLAGPGSFLDPAFRFQVVQPVKTLPVIKTGAYNNIVSFIGDVFSIKFSIPCDAQGKNGSFDYTNQNPTNGGTFHMENLVSVTCTNSRGAANQTTDFDTISFTGFGTWSRDPDKLDPHAASVNIFFDAPPSLTSVYHSPYISVQVDGAITSVVHTKPIAETLP